ncbi:hypothetical protein EC973_007903 [Apophysomyces ossiformis]|uniref:dual-specificity kinase n=1 Tax=Apophysomyces ossiformis TaxID=679940 RepID=A0A8H7EPI5_9FUNG|nr:hypothetical protein EC973_007903 [Apophysomyces ossiformis]
MSSSTVSDPYIREHWKYMQQQRDEEEYAGYKQFANSNEPSSAMSHEGRSKKSAVSRTDTKFMDEPPIMQNSARNFTHLQKYTDDAGISRRGVFEAFDEVERELDDPKYTAPSSERKRSTAITRKASVTDHATRTDVGSASGRRKSLASALGTTIKLRRKSRGQADGNCTTLHAITTTENDPRIPSPRLCTLRTKKSADNLATGSPKLNTTSLRRHASSGSTLTSKQAGHSQNRRPVSSKGSGKLPSEYQLDEDKWSTAHAISKDSNMCRSADDQRALRPRAKSLREANTSARCVEPIDQKARIVDVLYDALNERRSNNREYNSHVEKGAHTKQRTRSRALRSPPPPLAHASHDPPSLPNVNVRRIQEVVDSPPVKYTEPTIAACDNYDRSSHQQKNFVQREKSSLTSAEVITNIKRRLSIGKAKVQQLEDTLSNKSGIALTTDRKSLPANFTPRKERQRTLSSGSKLLVATKIDNDTRRKSLAHTSSSRHLSDYTGYSKSTVTSQQRRSGMYSPPPRSSSSSTRTSKEGTPTPAAAEEEDNETIPPVPPVPRYHSMTMSNKLSAEDAASIVSSFDSCLSDKNSKKMSCQRTSEISYSETDDSDNSHSKTSSSDRYTFSRTKEKSPSTLYNESNNNVCVRSNRTSRTENLKERVPTSSSYGSIAHLKHAVAEPDTPSFTDRRSNRGSNSHSTASETLGKAPTTTRKRGKTLPGSLAAPPPIPSLPLPPMKLEPMNLNMRLPKRKSFSKSPMIRATATTPTRIPVPVSKQSVSRSAQYDSLNYSADRIRVDEDASVTTAKEDRNSIGMSGKSQIPFISPKHTPEPSKTGSQKSDEPSGPARPSRRKQSLSASTAPKIPQFDTGLSPRIDSTVVATSRSRKTSTASNGTLSRTTSGYAIGKSSSASAELEALDKEKEERHRGISLHEKLQAMVAQHAMDEKRTANADDRSLRETAKTNSCKADERLLPNDRMKVKRASNSSLQEKERIEVGARSPKNPDIAIKYYAQYLSLYEQSEIRDFPQVYFIGSHAKKNPATLDLPECNYGYDDERGDYKIVLQDHLAYRYEVLDVLGRGSFGQVVKCFDHKTGLTVAIKLIRNKKRFHAQALTEIKILKRLVDWDPEDRYHNIRMTDYFSFRNHLCIACECLSMNLYEFIKSNNFQGFSQSLIKRFTVQLLQSLCLLQDHKVIHCDLKPENILLKHPTKSTIKVIDFGSSCFENEKG